MRSDPYERADITSNTYYDWFLSQPYLIFAAQTGVGKFLATFKEYPPRQRAASFSVDQIIEQMQRRLSTPYVGLITNRPVRRHRKCWHNCRARHRAQALLRPTGAARKPPGGPQGMVLRSGPADDWVPRLPHKAQNSTSSSSS